MIYEYSCCNEIFEVIKPLREIDRVESCPICGDAARRIISQNTFYGADDWDNAQYCPGLGQVVKSDKHRRKIARSRGLEEVGNEDMAKISAQWAEDRRRQDDARLESAARDAYNSGFDG